MINQGRSKRTRKEENGGRKKGTFAIHTIKAVAELGMGWNRRSCQFVFDQHFSLYNKHSLLDSRVSAAAAINI